MELISSTQRRVEVITDTQPKQILTIGPEVKFHYLVILRDDAQMDIQIYGQEHSQAYITVLCLGQAGHHIQSTVVTSLEGLQAEANVSLISLLTDGADVALHGNITLAPNVEKVSWHLTEENLILWERVKLRTAPILDVRSSDVSASHGCKVERLDPKRLFYMQSRGLDQSMAQSLVLDGYLNTIFEWYDGYESLIADIKQTLLSV